MTRTIVVHVSIDSNYVRLFVYDWFADRGDAPTAKDVATCFGVSDAAALTVLRELDDAHLVVLDRHREQIVVAHPWSAIPLGFTVSGSSQKWWGGCVWDSFAIPALLGEPSHVATHCTGCGRALALDVAPDHPPTEDWVAHFLIPVPRMWDDVVYTCSNQLLFCSRDHVQDWLARGGHHEGAVLDMRTLWTLATTWYEGRLTPEYRRRTPTEAAEYYTGIGLVGDFWRTTD